MSRLVLLVHERLGPKTLYAKLADNVLRNNSFNPIHIFDPDPKKNTVGIVSTDTRYYTRKLLEPKKNFLLMIGTDNHKTDEKFINKHRGLIFGCDHYDYVNAHWYFEDFLIHNKFM